MTTDEIRIRDVSRPPTRQWIPPIGAMGGPPAHELYRDLVQYAGLRLVRDAQGTPCVALRDGEHRRTLRVPSVELREALDRFRMRRNQRPVPDQELAEFVRVVEARVSDPDIFVPSHDVGESDASPPSFASRPSAAPILPAVPSPPPPPRLTRWETQLDSILREVDEVRGPAPPREAPAKAPSAWTDVVEHLGPNVPTVPRPNPSISGGRATPEPASGLPRYLNVLQGLVRGGGWIGTTSELSDLVGEKPDRVFANLRSYRSDLAGNDLLIVPVETREGWRWLAIDRHQLTSIDERRREPGPAAPVVVP